MLWIMALVYMIILIGLPTVKKKTPVPLCKGEILVQVRGGPRIKPQDFSRKPIFPPPAPKPKTRVTKT